MAHGIPSSWNTARMETSLTYSTAICLWALRVLLIGLNRLLKEWTISIATKSFIEISSLQSESYLSQVKLMKSAEIKFSRPGNLEAEMRKDFS